MRVGCCIGGQQAGRDHEQEGLLREAGQESECLGAAQEGEGVSQVAAGTQRGGSKQRVVVSVCMEYIESCVP